MSVAGRFGAFWGVFGVIALVVDAIYRLWPLAVEGWTMPWSWIHWAVFAPWLVFMAYSEGYRGFQQLFAPRVVARARALLDHPRPLWIAFAPLFVMGLMGATRKRLLVSRILIAGIVVLIVIVRLLPQPWRGIVDAGVVLGLTWGTAALLWFSFAALLGRPPSIDPDLPEEVA